ncbi:MAG: hypothetical protein BJ554DRAFT_4394, partial [Olpidium bornovanus]
QSGGWAQRQSGIKGASNSQPLRGHRLSIRGPPSRNWWVKQSRHHQIWCEIPVKNLVSLVFFPLPLSPTGPEEPRFSLITTLHRHSRRSAGVGDATAAIFAGTLRKNDDSAGPSAFLHPYSGFQLFLASVLTLTAITYERYLTVVKGTEFTGVAFLIFLPANWCFSAVLAAMPFLWVNHPYPLRSSGIYCSGEIQIRRSSVIANSRLPFSCSYDTSETAFTGGWYFANPYDVMFTVLGFCVITTGLCGITLMYRQIFKSVRENVRRLTGAGGQASWHSADDNQPNGTGGKGAHSAVLEIEQRVKENVRATLNVPPTPVCGVNGRIADGAFTRRALSNENVIARVTLTRDWSVNCGLVAHITGTLQKPPCWMDISVVVTVNNGATAAAEPKHHNRTVSRPADGGRSFGMELATLRPGAARLKQEKRFGKEEKQSMDSVRLRAEAEKAGGDSPPLPNSSLSSAASSDSGEQTLQPDDQHAGRAVSALAAPPAVARASNGDFAVVRKLERSCSAAN